MRKISLFFILCMIAVGMHAQELTEQETQAKEDSIFNIKFSEQAHYAEVVIDMVTDDNEAVSLAEQQSIALLQTHVIEIFAKRLHMSNQDVREIWDVIDDKCQNIEIRRGDLLRIFTYMAKDAVNSWLKGKKVKPLSPEDSLVLFGPKEETVKIQETKNEVIKTDTIKENVSVSITETDVTDTLPEPTITEPKKEISIPDFCKKLLDKKNKKDLEVYLEDGALYNELMYGNSDDMQYLSKCYVIIIEKETEEIKAILDKGEAARLNFITKDMDYLGNYNKEKFELIYVQEIK